MTQTTFTFPTEFDTDGMTNYEAGVWSRRNIEGFMFDIQQKYGITVDVGHNNASGEGLDVKDWRYSPKIVDAPNEYIQLRAVAQNMAKTLDDFLSCRLFDTGLQTTPDILAQAGHALRIWRDKYDRQ